MKFIEFDLTHRAYGHELTEEFVGRLEVFQEEQMAS